METFTKGRGSRVGFVLVDKKKLLKKNLLKMLGWMTLHVGLLERY